VANPSLTMPVTGTGNRATESMSEACPNNTFASGTKPSPLMARTGSSRQRNRMPAIEVETDGRETQPAPPRLTHFGPRWVVSLSTTCCGPMVLGLIERRLPPRRAKTGRRNHRDRRYIALPCALPIGVPRTFGRVNAAGHRQDATTVMGPINFRRSIVHLRLIVFCGS
jgi:hypothetical protein